MSVPYSKRLQFLRKVDNLLECCSVPGEVICFEDEQIASCKVAYIVHAFYPDVAFRLFDKIQHTPQEFDIFITCPYEMPLYFYRDVFLRFPHAKLLQVQNKGRDILPWLLLNKRFDFSNYNAICKLHTKKSPHRSDSGEYGLKTAIEGLIKDRDTIASNISIVQTNKCMLASKNAMAVISKNEKTEKFTIFVNKLFHIVKKLHVNNYRNLKAIVPDINLSNLSFVAGTMFWYHPDSVRKLLSLDLQENIFEEEPIEPDGYIPHAIERLFGWSAGSIYEV